MKCGARRTTQVQVRKVTVQTTEVPLSDLKVPEATVQELQSVEASMRVDAVASAGFRMSRSKMLAAVKNGDVRVNWLPCSKPSREVEAGDLIACAGKVSFQMLLECLQSDACLNKKLSARTDRSGTGWHDPSFDSQSVAERHA